MRCALDKRCPHGCWRRCPACRRPVKRVTTQRGSVAVVDLTPRQGGSMYPVAAGRFMYRLPAERKGPAYSLHHRSGTCLPVRDDEEDEV